MAVAIEQITKDRFARWGRRFVEESATPILAMGVGHDENLGKIVLCTVEDQEVSIEFIRAFLKDALRSLGG